FQTPAPATRVILGVLVGVFIAGWLVAGQVESEFGELSDSVLPMVIFGAKINAEIEQGAWWRLLTHTMIHGGWLHLILNGYGLFLLGTISERLFGTRRFILIYGIAGVAG